jgi:small subunit ribosomal protein S1
MSDVTNEPVLETAENLSAPSTTTPESVAEAPLQEAPAPADISAEVPASPEAPVSTEAVAPAEEPVAETPSASDHTEAPVSEDSTETKEAKESKKERVEKPSYDADALYTELVAAKKAGATVEVEGSRRVRGGILATYKNMPLFLPTSHLSLKVNPSETDHLVLLRQTFTVHVHELNEKDKSRVIVTRRRLLRGDEMKNYHVGQEVEGKVVSFTEFGAFVNLGPVDGMIHVSAISNRRIAKPQDILKKGDTIRAIIKEIDPAKERISLSMKELEANPWDTLEEELPPGTHIKGIVRGVTDFGVYVEVKAGVEGMVHISEMSWAKRLKHPSELFEKGQDIEVVVLSVATGKRKLQLGYKQLQPNPWDAIAEKFTIGQKTQGTVKEITQSGIIITLTDEIDGFMPRGKMLPNLRNQKDPFKSGDAIEVLIMDLSSENRSLILGMEGFDQGAPEGGDRPERSERPRREGGGNREGGGHREGGSREGRPRREGGNNDRRERRDNRENRENLPAPQAVQSEMTLSDLLSEDERKRLFGE